MSTLTREKIETITGRLENDLIVEILNTGASEAEVAEAFGWFSDSIGMKAAGHHRPTGRVPKICEILETSRAPETDLGPK